jgi:UDP-N-acetylglucosamine--N-acetylmuramyl-(pentapeptide) pyrophosphoryl-undecaprenol N-acetylglucosamine transferase
LTVAARLAADEHNAVAFVGTPDGLEARLVPEAGFEFHGLAAKGFNRAKPSTLVTSSFTILASFFRAMGILWRYKPDVVVGFGGYVSLPLGAAAAFAGVPLVLHEQNSVPGLANRVLSRWAQAVCVTYPSSIAYLAYPLRAVVTGDPVRDDIPRASRDAGRRAFKLRKKDLVLLVFGGSRGARHLNSATVDLYQRLSNVPDLRVLHIAGPSEAESVLAALKGAAGGAMPKWYRVLDYVENMGDAIAASDLVVCRAGATTIAELTVLGRPALLVPYPYATSDHQTLNAESMVDAGAAWRITDADLDKSTFGDELLRLLADPGRRKAMEDASRLMGRPSAAEELVEVAMETACRSGRNTDVCEQAAAARAAADAKAAKAAKRAAKAAAVVPAESAVPVVAAEPPIATAESPAGAAPADASGVGTSASGTDDMTPEEPSTDGTPEPGEIAAGEGSAS